MVYGQVPFSLLWEWLGLLDLALTPTRLHWWCLYLYEIKILNVFSIFFAYSHFSPSSSHFTFAALCLIVGAVTVSQIMWPWTARHRDWLTWSRLFGGRGCPSEHLTGYSLCGTFYPMPGGREVLPHIICCCFYHWFSLWLSSQTLVRSGFCFPSDLFQTGFWISHNLYFPVYLEASTDTSFSYFYSFYFMYSTDIY